MTNPGDERRTGPAPSGPLPAGGAWPQQGYPQAPGYPQQPPGQAGYPQGSGYPQGHGYGQGYGQPAPGQPQQGGQWGQGSSYGGFGAFEEKPRKTGRSWKPWAIGAAVVVVLGGGGAYAWLSGVFSGPVLDRNSLQTGVQSVLRDDFGEGDVKNVSCPEDQPVKTGTTFDCTVTVAGQAKKVTVRVLNDQAQFEVGAPK